MALTESEELELLELEEAEAKAKRQSQVSAWQKQTQQIPSIAQRSGLVLQSIKNAAVNPNTYTKPISIPLSAGARIIAKNPEGALDALSTIGAVGGSFAGPGGAVLGAVAGEGIKQAGRSLLGLKPVSGQQPRIGVPFTGIGVDIQDIPYIPKQVSRMAIEGGLAGIGDLAGLAAKGLKILPGIEKGAESASTAGARRAFGFNKSLIKRAGGLEKANESAKEMFEKGAVSRLSVNKTLENVENIKDASGKQIGGFIETLDKNGVKSIDTRNLISKIEERFPTRSGGLYNEEKTAVNNVINTIKSHGEKMLDFKELKGLVKTVGRAANFKNPNPSVAEDIYRQAYGIMSDEVENSVRAAGEESLKSGFYIKGLSGRDLAKYEAAKKTYGAANDVERALTDKQAALAGNRAISLTDIILSSGELASGSPGKALTSIIAKKASEKFGGPLTAYGAKSIGSVINQLRTLPETAMSQAFIQALRNRRKQ